MSFDDKSIETKESLWKEKLLSRKFGYKIKKWIVTIFTCNSPFL